MSNQRASHPTLVIRHTGQVFPLSQAPVTVGRQADNTIVLADPQASRHHAAVTWQAGAFVVQDMGSANGTFVNNQRIAGPRSLRDGDSIRMGNTIFDVRLPPVAEQEQTMVGAALPPERATGPGKRSFLPILIGVLLSAIVLVGLAIVAFLLLSGDDQATPTVAIQSPSQGAEIAIGTEIILQAAAAGARDITRLEIKVDDILAGVSTSSDPAGTGALTVSQPWTFSQAGPHTVTAMAYTAGSRVSDPTLVEVLVMEMIAQETPTGTPSATPTTEVPSDTPTPTTLPTDIPSTDTPTPTDTASPTSTATPTSTPTPSPTLTPTPTETPEPIVEFWADETTIVAGGSTFLRWRVENVQAIYLDGAPVTGPDGQRAVNPASTTTYTLRATHAGGEETKLVTITVIPSGQAWSHPLKVAANRRIYHIRLAAPGEIRVRAQWTGPQGDLAIIINGPGQTGYYARRDGASPLEVAYNVTGTDLAAGQEWRVTIASFGTGRADGTIRITYPSGSGSGPLLNDFAVAPGFGSAVSAIVLGGPGPIQASATWSGIPTSMALIVNGPGQVGYYARQDGPSPLSVSYSVSPADFGSGDTWFVSLTALSPPNADGSINLSFP